MANNAIAFDVRLPNPSTSERLEKPTPSQPPNARFRSRELGAIAKHGINADATVVELGCGKGGMATALAKCVPQGRAIGLDTDALTVSRQKTKAHLERANNMRFVVSNHRRLPIQTAYADITIARFLLQTSLDPDRVVEEMVRITRPGGLVVCIDAHADSVVISPAPEGMDRLLSAARMTRRMQGGDPRMGRRIAQLMQRAGLTAIEEEQLVHSSQGMGLVRYVDAAFSGGLFGVDLGHIDPNLLSARKIRSILMNLAKLDGRAGTLARARVTVATGRVPLH